MRRSWSGLLVLALLLGWAVSASAQTTGSINGTITDNTSAVLPGVTVTATSPAMMGSQTGVTNEQGQYRFPSVPPGTYKLTYEMQGFSTTVRDGIVVNIGFAATVNVQLQLASLQESVTVSGQSPVVDVQNTNVQFNFTTEMMQNIPNARDIWALIGEAPGMMVTRFDVGGSRAGTQTGFSAYGFSGQIRAQIDGVNTTEGTGAAGFYYDYGSFEEIQLGTDGNDASSTTPGTQLNAVIKSGGNQFRGNFYLDFENESLQGRNVDDRLRRLGIGEGSRITRYYDPNGDVGGPVMEDKLWYFTSWRSQRIGTTVSGFPPDAPSDFEFLTRLQNGTYKVTYQLTPNNKIGHYVQLGRKLQPHRDASTTAYFDSVFKQDSLSYAGNVDWNSIINPQFFFTARLATFGYNWPDLPYGTDGSLNANLAMRRRDQGTGNTQGSFNPRRNNRRRIQADWTATYFKDDWMGGSHAFKFGFLTEREGQIFKDEGFVDALRVIYNTTGGGRDFTTPYRVEIRNTPRLAENYTWHDGAFLTDQWTLGPKLTLNLGIRWDYYSSFYSDEEVLPGPYRDFFYAGRPLPNGYSLPATPFASTFKVPGQSGISRHPALFAPRVGVAWDLFGDGKTVLKGNWGRFYQNTGLVDTLNPLQALTYTFNWNDRNGDQVFQTNEFGTFVSSTGATNNLIDPNLKDTYTASTSFWIERQLFNNVAARVGYTFRQDHDINYDVQLNRVRELYTRRREFPDPGPDGTAGNADDGPTIVGWDIPGTIPPSRTESRTIQGPFQVDRAFDATLSKRMSNRWSMTTNFIYNWDHDRGFPQNPNQDRFIERTITAWAWKTFGTWQGPYGLVISPVLRHQSGDARDRVVQVTLSTGTLDYQAEPEGAYREDNIWIFDTRIEKRFRFGSRTLSAFLDAFNIANSNAAETQDVITGRRTTRVDGQSVNYQRFLRPTVVLSPRVFKVGFRFLF
jgi:hypothetical protein